MMTPEEILNSSIKDKLFDYTQEEVDDFNTGFDGAYLKSMFQAIDKGIDSSSHNNKLNRIIEYLSVLTEEDLNDFDKNYLQKYTDVNPNMLWNMLSKYDKMLYKMPDKFYEWFSKLDDDSLDSYIYRAADGKKLHPDYIYDKDPTTKVEILDGYIAISSSNLGALDRFKERVLEANDCSFEHRIKMHGDVKIHSYVFDLNDKNS